MRTKELSSKPVFIYSDFSESNPADKGFVFSIPKGIRSAGLLSQLSSSNKAHETVLEFLFEVVIGSHTDCK